MTWWMILQKRSSLPSDAIAACELPSGKDDPGLMASDLIVLFNAIINNAHPDLTNKEIRNCFNEAFKDYMVVNKVLVIRKKAIKHTKKLTGKK
jgi:hypothetical protein